MKILVCIPSSMTFGSQNGNGLALAARELSRALSIDRGVEVDILGKFSDSEDWYNQIPIDLSNRCHQESLFKAIIEQCSKVKYDLIHLHANFYLTIKAAIKLPEKVNCPIVITHHSPFIAGITANSLRDSILKLNDINLNYPGPFVHHDLEKYFNEQGNIKYKVISNLPCEFKYLGLEKEKLAVIVTRLDFMKNPVYNLRLAIKDARETGYKLVVIGSSKILVENNQSINLRDQSMKLIEDNKDIIEHFEHLTRDEINVVLNRARLAYQFSTTENQALVPIEANASGCVVAGYREVLPHVDSDVNLLVSKADNISSTNFIKLAEQIDPLDVRSFFEDKFNRDNILDQWIEYYDGIIKEFNS